MGFDIITNERDKGFTTGGIEFRVHVPGEPELVTDERRGAAPKPTFPGKYDRVFRSLPVRNVLEFGIAQGGAIICVALAHPDFGDEPFAEVTEDTCHFYAPSRQRRDVPDIRSQAVAHMRPASR